MRSTRNGEAPEAGRDVELRARKHRERREQRPYHERSEERDLRGDDAGGCVEEVQRGRRRRRSAPAIAAFTAPAVPYRNVNASVMRNDGRASTVSMSRPTTRDPGNGTNASTIARNVPRTRQPTRRRRRDRDRPPQRVAEHLATRARSTRCRNRVGLTDFQRFEAHPNQRIQRGDQDDGQRRDRPQPARANAAAAATAGACGFSRGLFEQRCHAVVPWNENPGGLGQPHARPRLPMSICALPGHVDVDELIGQAVDGEHQPGGRAAPDRSLDGGPQRITVTERDDLHRVRPNAQQCRRIRRPVDLARRWAAAPRR